MAVTIRKGGVADINWVAAELVKGSNAGHFSRSVASQASQVVSQIVHGGGGLQMMKLRNGMKTPCLVLATLLVAEVDNSPAAFLITLLDQGEVEIHLGGTVSAFRRNGIFRMLVQHEINTYKLSASRIFARCYKKSTWAISAFQSLGFKVTAKGDPIELTL